MTSNPGDPSEKPDNRADQSESSPERNLGGKPPRRFRPRGRSGENQERKKQPENLVGGDTPTHSGEQRTMPQNNPSRAQNSRRRQSHAQGGQRPPRGDGSPPGGGQVANPAGETPQPAASRQKNNNRQGGRQSGNNRQGNRGQGDFRERRGSQANEARGDPSSANRPNIGSGPDRGDSPLIPPPNELPTFIGPEFRQVDYPENRRPNPPETRGDQAKPGNNQPRRRKGARGKGNFNPQRQPREQQAPGGENPGSEAVTSRPKFEGYREAKRGTQAGNRGQNQPAPRGRQPDRRGNRSPQPVSRPENTYVSLADRYSQDRPAPSVPIPTDRGIKLRSQRGASKNWWARRWIDAMERLVDPARLQRGRSYARSGQVLSIQENRSGVEAMVQGSRPQPYKVTIQVTHLSNAQWDLVVDALSEQALFTAQLLAGEMPANIESAFETAGVSLFPNRGGDLNTGCSCPDWANPCKHVAASHYILGDRFDDDPFLLFRMRGRTQEQIMDALRQRRGGLASELDETEAPASNAPNLEEQMAHFWEPAEDLDSFPLTINPPTVDMPLLKRLGEPNFLGGESLLNLFKPVYDSFTRGALRAAYTEDEPLEENGN